MIYSIHYDLKKPGQDYAPLHDAITSCGVWWHYLDSTWLVDTNLTAESIWKKLEHHVDENDSMLIVGVTRDYSGWLPRKAWEWIKRRQAAAV